MEKNVGSVSKEKTQNKQSSQASTSMSSSSNDNYDLDDTEAFPILSGERQSKSKMRNAHVEPKRLSHRSSSAGLQTTTLKKDWSPADDDLIRQGQTDSLIPIFSKTTKRLSSFIQICPGSESETETHEPDFSSS